MSAVVVYRGAFGEVIRVPADSLGRRTEFPIAEFADRLEGEKDRAALGIFSFKQAYDEVRAFIAGQDHWVAQGKPLRAAPGRYFR